MLTQTPGTRTINKYIYTALKCTWFQVCKVSLARKPLSPLKSVTNRKKKKNIFMVVIFFTFTSIFTSGTLYTVIVIALFLHILWDAGLHPLVPHTATQHFKTAIRLQSTRGHHRPLNLSHLLTLWKQQGLVWHFWYAGRPYCFLVCSSVLKDTKKRFKLNLVQHLDLGCLHSSLGTKITDCYLVLDNSRWILT